MSQKLILLTGPTGGGKTQICSRLDPDKYEIVSFDSRQVYRYLQWGTAKPSPQERERVCHHLVDFLEPSESINARIYSDLAESAVLQIWDRKKQPVLTAGTGFYLKAFLYGMFSVPDIPDEVRKYLNELSDEEKLSLLKEKNPSSLHGIHPNDSYRVHRALEVCLSGESWTNAQEKKEQGFLDRFQPEVEGFFIEWDRAELYKRINQRAAEIIERGLIEETKYVMERYGKECPAMQALGYSFAIEYIEGSRNRDSLIEAFSQSHRNYAKKQITWFKRESLVKTSSFQKILDNFDLQKFIYE